MAAAPKKNESKENEANASKSKQNLGDLKKIVLQGVDDATMFFECDNSRLPEIPYGSYNVIVPTPFIAATITPGVTLLDACSQLSLVNDGLIPNQPIFNCCDISKIVGGGKIAFVPVFRGRVTFKNGKVQTKPLKCPIAVWNVKSMMYCT